MKRVVCLLFGWAVMSLCLTAVPVAGGGATGREQREMWDRERHYPPLVFTSKAWLNCSISSTKNGRQTMETVSGPGFTFDAVMRPIADGEVLPSGPGREERLMEKRVVLGSAEQPATVITTLYEDEEDVRVLK